ncbi:MAG: phosphate ABC transporter permease subunit PstC [Dehalobacter sp. 4CP]|uniref:phosphate ABC transporter permease subunit PstC n=2 Tax=unclassified Dehalobacter TaxID=2635733 RepID=UPI0013C6AFC6|nr:phosphate ABC transporter permease subunit PstC [Dehalobacter sp. 4CP]
MQKSIHLKKSEIIVEKILLLSAVAAIFIIALIAVFVIISGWPVLQKTGFFNFVLGTTWDPTHGIYGILPMVVGSILVTLGALVLGIPFGVAGAIFMAEIAPPKAAKLIRPAIELLAGIPSVVYGFYGLAVIVPLIRNHFGGTGFSILAGSLILAIMILPTILNLSETALRAVPNEYKDGSYALGANYWQTIKWISLPVARSGIITGVVLGMSRAIGETMAVIMVTGNVTRIPGTLFDPIRTLTGNIVMEMGYASGEHQQALFATGIILFIFIMILNLIVQFGAKGRWQK